MNRICFIFAIYTLLHTCVYSETITSANMSLPIPVVGSEPGPNYADDINSCMSIIDAHNHTPGYGLQIPTAGLNINADLTFSGFNATHLNASRYTPATISCGGADIDETFVTGVDLYYCDGSGNSIQLTSGGTPAGTPGSITGLVSPASASYNSTSKNITFNSNTNTRANVDMASLIIREMVSGANGVTIQSPSSLASSYHITLPAALPGATNFLRMDTGGNVTNSANVDNSTIGFTGNNLQVKSAGITATQIANQTITKVQLAASGLLTSSNSSVTTTNTSQIVVTNSAVTFQTALSFARPAIINFQGSSVNGRICATTTNATGLFLSNFYITRNAGNSPAPTTSTGVLVAVGSVTGTSSANPSSVCVPCSSLNGIDNPPGTGTTYTYAVYIASDAATTTSTVDSCVLNVYQL